MSSDVTGKKDDERKINDCEGSLAGIREAAAEITAMMRTIKEDAVRISVKVADIDAMGRTNKEKKAELNDAVARLRKAE